MRKFMHMLAHWFLINHGHVVSRLDDDGSLWIAFKCSTCGKIQGKVLSEYPQPWNRNEKYLKFLEKGR